jgi:hypothetical protein
MKSSMGTEVNTDRKTWPGKTTTDQLKRNIGLEEDNKPTYNRNEQALFENTTKVRRLVEQLEAKEVDKDETQ